MPSNNNLVLLPGLICTRALWSAQIDDLGGVAEILVPNLSGASSVAELAQSVLAAAPERFSLAGFSMGGYVAQEIMRRAPERVERLAFLNTSARADTAEQTSRRRGLIELAQKGEFRGVSPRLVPYFVHPDRVDDSVLVGIIAAMAQDTGRDGFINQQTAIIGRPDGIPDLSRIDVPTLVLVGRQDILTPLDCAEEIAALVPGADLVVLEDCAHMTPLERPAETTDALKKWFSRT